MATISKSLSSSHTAPNELPKSVPFPPNDELHQTTQGLTGDYDSSKFVCPFLNNVTHKATQLNKIPVRITPRTRQNSYSKSLRHCNKFGAPYTESFNANRNPCMVTTSYLPPFTKITNGSPDPSPQKITDDPYDPTVKQVTSGNSIPIRITSNSKFKTALFTSLVTRGHTKSNRIQIKTNN